MHRDKWPTCARLSCWPITPHSALFAITPYLGTNISYCTTALTILQCMQCRNAILRHIFTNFSPLFFVCPGQTMTNSHKQNHDHTIFRTRHRFLHQCARDYHYLHTFSIRPNWIPFRPRLYIRFFFLSCIILKLSRVHTGWPEHLRIYDLFRFVVLYLLRSFRYMMQFMSSSSKL